ncbi:hypothetical protein B296_00044402 [Ensete ventricosum]|uniref:Uncharacterized protein n=1 Tax=Ensete ventricosum TaxID=4639 RepID=A0A426XXH2_ENSVE|nr:hypothetical protein B296_00044402 [Ensete ventricosum]
MKALLSPLFQWCRSERFPPTTSNGDGSELFHIRRHQIHGKARAFGPLHPVLSRSVLSDSIHRSVLGHFVVRKCSALLKI